MELVGPVRVLYFPPYAAKKINYNETYDRLMVRYFKKGVNYL